MRAMNKIINPKDFYITSDLHLSHKLVSNLRGMSVEEHDKVIVDSLNSIPDGSTLMILGDISVRKDLHALTVIKKIKDRKNLTLILTPGNHDRVHPREGEAALMWAYEYNKVFDIVMERFMMKIDGQNFLFTHYPVWGSDAMNPKLESQKSIPWWAPVIPNTIVVHGHTHSDIPVTKGHINAALEAHDMKVLHVSRLIELSKEA